MLTTWNVTEKPENKYWKLFSPSAYDPASTYELGNSIPLERLRKKSFHLSVCPFIHLFPEQERGLTGEADKHDPGQVQPNAVCPSLCLSPCKSHMLSSPFEPYGCLGKTSQVPVTSCLSNLPTVEAPTVPTALLT